MILSLSKCKLPNLYFSLGCIFIVNNSNIKKHKSCFYIHLSKLKFYLISFTKVIKYNITTTHLPNTSFRNKTLWMDTLEATCVLLSPLIPVPFFHTFATYGVPFPTIHSIVLKFLCCHFLCFLL